MKLISKLLGATLLAYIAIGASAAVAIPPLVVFGDSLSDSGNNSLVFGNDSAQVSLINNTYIPGQTYGSGTYSNGPVWATQFATLMGFAPLAPSLVSGGTNYAYGGSVTGIDQTVPLPTPPGGSVTLPSLKTQVTSYIASVGGTVSPNGLYVVAGGGNDARSILGAVASSGNSGLIQPAVAQYVANVGLMVDALQLAGAQHIVVWDTPNIGVVPAVIAQGGTGLGTTIASSMNFALAARLAGEAGVLTFDIFGLPALAASNGFTNVTDACGNPNAACNSDLAHALFFDGIHPTTAAHSFIASQMQALVSAVPEPSEVAMMLVGFFAVVRIARRKTA